MLIADPFVAVPADLAALLLRDASLGVQLRGGRSRLPARYRQLLAALEQLAALTDARHDAETAAVPASRTLDVMEAALIAGLSPHGLREAARCGRVRAERVDGRWRFDEDDVRQYAEVRKAS